MILRFKRTAISQIWLMMSLRTASAKGLTATLRDLTASMKFWLWLRLSIKWTFVGPILDVQERLGLGVPTLARCGSSRRCR